MMMCVEYKGKWVIENVQTNHIVVIIKTNHVTDQTSASSENVNKINLNDGCLVFLLDSVYQIRRIDYKRC